MDVKLIIQLHGEAVERLSCAAQARRFGRQAGMTARGANELAIIVSELVSNVARHAQQGTLELRQACSTIEVFCRDQGPGIVDVQRVLHDGYSQGRLLLPDSPRAQGLGQGLGAVSRLSNHLSIQSQLGVGTTVFVRKQV